MATAKKKTSAKRTVKYAAKAQTAAKQTTAAAVKQVKQNSAWASKNASEWQKGASDWAKQSAKMYQLPFAQGDMGAAANQAADTVKSATENMVKMGSDMMQQFFGQAEKAKSSASQAFNPAAMFSQMPQMPSMPNFQMPQMPAMPNFNPAEAQEKLASFTRQSSEQLSKAGSNANKAMNESVAVAQENVAVITEVTNTAVTMSKELVAELISYTNKQFAQNVELSKQMLTCRTLNDMFDLSTRIMKSNLDGFFSESVKISEMIFQCATDVSEPLNECMTETTERLTKVIAS